MSDTDSKFTARSQSIFERFCNTVASASPLGAAVTVAAAIAPIAIFAATKEVMYMQDLLSAQGPDALKAFQSQIPESAMEYASKALTGSLPLQWQNIKALAYMAEATVPALTGISVFLAQNFMNLKRQVEGLKVENSLLRSGENLPSVNTGEARLTGATRVDNSESPARRFEQSLGAFNAKVQEPSQPPESRIKGPGL